MPAVHSTLFNISVRRWIHANTVLPKIVVTSKSKTNIISGANCPESFISRKEGDVSIISVCRAAGWDRF